MYRISKTFRFEAGHRVWKQNLACDRGSEFVNDKSTLQNKCVNLHGHSYVLEVELESETLTEQEMVMDFHHVKNALKSLIDTIDHSFIIDINDPLYNEFEELATKYGLKVFPVTFCPTAEKLAEFFYEFLTNKLQEAGLSNEVRVSRITLWETATSKAEFLGNQTNNQRKKE